MHEQSVMLLRVNSTLYKNVSRKGQNLLLLFANVAYMYDHHLKIGNNTDKSQNCYKLLDKTTHCAGKTFPWLANTESKRSVYKPVLIFILYARKSYQLPHACRKLSLQNQKRIH